MTICIIAEKSDAAKHIAKALSDGRPKKITSQFGVDYYEFKKKGKKHLVVAAVGHLFNLKQSKRLKGWSYPVFDTEWQPSFKIRKASAFSEKYFRTLEMIAEKNKNAKCVIACDYDNEGTVIGYNILKFIFNQDKAKRMKFSTLTKPDLIKSYENMEKEIDWNNLECGLARHMIDFYYGISTSRALTSAIKKYAKRFSLLTAGRVQGPTLYFLFEREKLIKKFKSKPFWLLQALVKLGKQNIIAPHDISKFWKKPEAEKAFKNSKGKAIVEKVTKKEYLQKPPIPFNITSLQTESYKLFGYTPQQTMRIAQDLYTKAFISYPRTSSERFPPQIGFKEIIQALSNVRGYEKLCNELLEKGELKPTEGKRTDPAHEAIHPTVEPPKRKLSGPSHKIYDLVCRRFFAVFGDPAKKERVKVNLKIGKEKYSLNGRRTISKGWIKYYGPLSKFDEVILPDLKEGDKINIKKLEMLDKETSPPSRYSAASVIKEMEKRGLGTRATRSAILETLYNRNYIDDKSIRVTDLGMKISETLKKYVPDFVDEEMTKKLEKEMEKIIAGKLKKEKILSDAKKAVTKICDDFKANEKKIGKSLEKAVIQTQDDSKKLGPCPNCGGDLKVLFSIFTKKHFCGCSNYNRCAVCGFTKKACKCKCPICGGIKGKCECKWKEKIWKPTCQTGYPLPHRATFRREDKLCDKCNTPIIRVFRKGKRPFRMCLDPKCILKKDWGKPKKGKKKVVKKKPKKVVKKKK